MRRVAVTSPLQSVRWDKMHVDLSPFPNTVLWSSHPCNPPVRAAMQTHIAGAWNAQEILVVAFLDERRVGQIRGDDRLVDHDCYIFDHDAIVVGCTAAALLAEASVAGAEH